MTRWCKLVLGFEGDTADAIWRDAFRAIRSDGEVIDGRDQPARELLHATFTIRRPRNRVVFAIPINPAFSIVETIWTLAGRNDVAFLHAWNKRMGRWSDDGKLFHGSYGFRLRKHFGIDQLTRAAEVLSEEPASRQVVLQFWDSKKDLPNPRPRSRDIPCNVASHLLLRKGRLEWLQIMRSNDLIWGTPNNLLQFTTLQEIVAGWVGAEVGTYSHVSDSLHVYKRHWDLFHKLRLESASPPRNLSDMRLPFDRWQRTWARLVRIVDELSRAEDLDCVEEVLGRSKKLPRAYFEWAAILAAETARRLGAMETALRLAEAGGEYWGTSWKLWAQSKQEANRGLANPDGVLLPAELSLEVGG